jgi:hypothetical protein
MLYRVLDPPLLLSFQLLLYIVLGMRRMHPHALSSWIFTLIRFFVILSSSWLVEGE